MSEDRFSKVSRRVWGDERVRRLSWPPPNGLTLWQRLLTGPELTNIPGVFQAWEAGLAQALRWSLKGFREAFAEVLAEGLAKADWEVGLVWVPRAINHNRPANPNVVRSWRSTWALLPDCAMKTEAYHGLKSFLEGLPEGFAKAFTEVCENPLPNQEQEQEQEQESRDPPVGPPGDRVRRMRAESQRVTRLWKFVPDDWPGPDESDQALALSLGVDCSAEEAKFRDHEFAKPKSNAKRAFRNWLREAARRQQVSGKPQPVDLFARARRIAAEEGQ